MYNLSLIEVFFKYCQIHVQQSYVTIHVHVTILYITKKINCFKRYASQ